MSWVNHRRLAFFDRDGFTGAILLADQAAGTASCLDAALGKPGGQAEQDAPGA